MNPGLPESYASPVELPFNTASLAAHFQLGTPDQDPGTCGIWLILQGGNLLTVTGANGPELPRGDSPLLISTRPPLYIGTWDGLPCRLLDLPRGTDYPDALQEHSLLAREPQLSLPLLSLGGVGQMIRHWEMSSQYCGYCGHSTRHIAKEWGKTCQNCGKHHYPRLHPCVIGLVVKGDEILLVRNVNWPEERYGLVAGYVEFGECLEEALAREVHEETGLHISNIRFVGSQCWPFPSQLMCGFVADYSGGEIRLQEDELAAADWFSLDHLPVLPPRRSIARYLIDQAQDYLQTRNLLS